MTTTLRVYRGAGGPSLSRRTRDLIIAEVAAKYGVLPVLILSNCSARIASRPRQEVMWRLVGLGYSTLEVGRALNRDHSTVVHGARRHKARMIARDPGELEVAA